MTTTVSGGGGAGYPGVTTDGNNGLTVQHSFAAGDPNAASSPDFLFFAGNAEIDDTPANLVAGVRTLKIEQITDLLAGSKGFQAFQVDRVGSVAARDYQTPVATFRDLSASAQPVFSLQKGATTVLEINTIKSITGALSTVTDAAAKAVLTSIIATLTGIKVATNNTT